MSLPGRRVVDAQFGTAEVHDVYSLNDRLSLINGQVFKSLREPSIRALALDLVRGTPQHGHESELAELSRVFWFVKKNVEYRQDPHQYDLYSTAQRTLQTKSGDCFTLDTPVIVRSKVSGGYEIKTLGSLETSWPAYEALTYDFSATTWTFKPITAWTFKGTKEVFESHLSNGPRFKHTLDHSVWWLDGQKPSTKIVDSPLGRYLENSDTRHRRVLVAQKIPALGSVDLQKSHAYLAGIFAAEGFSDEYHVRIAQDKPEIRAKIEKSLNDAGVDYSKSKRERNAYYSIYRSEFKDWLRAQGSSSFDMSFGKDVLAGSEEVIRAAYDAYCDGDSYHPKVGSVWENKVKCIASTSSDRLALELQLMLMILGEPWHNYYQINHMGTGKRPIHRVHNWSDNSVTAKRGVLELPGVAYSNLKSMSFIGEESVCDITVADTHNFVLGNGMIVHNCDDHCILTSSLAGNLGFIPGAKVISPDGANWHIYALTSVFPRSNPQAPTARYLALDTTQPASHPGWEPSAKFQRYARVVTFTESGPLVQTVR